jgi:hypothetical protein
MGAPSELAPAGKNPWDPPAYLRLAMSMPGICRVHDGLIVAGRLDNTPDRAAVFSAVHAESLQLADFTGKEVSAVGWLTHWYDRVDELTGKNTGYWRTVILSGGPERYQTASGQVLRALCDLVGYNGAPPWQPPLRLKVTGGKAPGGHRFMSVEWVQPETLAPEEDF